MVSSQQNTVTIELPVPEPTPVTVDPSCTALVIVDMENDFCKPGGAVYGSQRREAVIKPIQRLLYRCRDTGIQVIFVQSIRYHDSPEFRFFGKEPYAIHGTWGARIVDELTPVASEPIVEKNSHDCFNDTRMEELLVEKGIEPLDWTIIVVGLGLTNCVGCAISGFSVRNYWVVVPMDCTASRTWEEEICQYQRFMQRGYNYNVALTRSELIQIAR